LRSFLLNRSQKVRIEDVLSDSADLDSGVLQGGILSPWLYIIYVADIQEWLKWSNMITCADDTSTSFSNAELFVLLEKLEEDFECILRFMELNDFVACPKKLHLLYSIKKLMKQHRFDLCRFGLAVSQCC
jgi:hypothetical protein